MRDNMTADLYALGWSANDPDRLAEFWSGVLHWGPPRLTDHSPEILPVDDTGFRIRFQTTDAAKVAPNQMHFDLTSSSLEAQQETVARALELGGRHIDVGQLPEEGHVVLADPEGNEFCVIEPGNIFLADCGFIGAVSSDGSREVGYFWSQALGWPLVWDQDEETAIRSPRGGPKVTWGGSPIRPKAGPNRLHLELAPSRGSHQQDEVARLVSLGATRLGIEHTATCSVVLADPDGNEFCVLPS